MSYVHAYLRYTAQNRLCQEDRLSSPPLKERGLPGEVIKSGAVWAMRNTIPINGKFYIETSLSDGLINIAAELRPDRVTIVPEETGEKASNTLDIKKEFADIKNIVELLHVQGIPVCLSVEPDREAIDLAKGCGADFIEICTAAYSKTSDKAEIEKEIDRIYRASEHAAGIRIKINAGGGLNYRNVVPILHARELLELNIGRAILSRSDSVGLSKAVQEMMDVLD